MRIVIHGGDPTNNSNIDVIKNFNFFREIAGGLKTLRVLALPFATYDIYIRMKVLYDSLTYVNPHIPIKIEYLQNDNFHLMKWANAIYVFGFNGQLLQYRLLEYLKTLNVQDEFSDELFKKDVLAGSSEGVEVFGSYYYSNIHNKPADGLGYIRNMATICKYRSDKYGKLHQLMNMAGSSSLYPIQENEFISLEVK